MGEYFFKTPEGFNDTLSNECMIRVEVENSIRKIFKSNGFNEVDTPTLEYYDLFNGSIEAIPQERMFKLFDSRGRILVLRPDITVPIMRMASTKMGDINYPLRLSYFGNIFRSDNRNLLSCEYRQAGIEILNTDSINADAEVIGIIINSLKSSGINDFRIDIGQVKLFKALTKGLNKQLMEDIRQSVANKDRFNMEKLLNNTDIDADRKAFIMKLPWLFGSIEILQNIKTFLKDEDAIDALNELNTLIEILINRGYDKNISIDLGMVQDLNYYSGIIFRGYTAECGFSICWGGRYNYLSQNFNKEIPATGCAIGINRIVEVLIRKGRLDNIKGSDYFVTTMNDTFKTSAFKASEILRSKGYDVENDLLYDDRKIMQYCIDKKINTLLKLVDAYNIEIIDVQTGSSTNCTLDCLYEWEDK